MITYSSFPSLNYLARALTICVGIVTALFILIKTNEISYPDVKITFQRNIDDQKLDSYEYNVINSKKDTEYLPRNSRQINIVFQTPSHISEEFANLIRKLPRKYLTFEYFSGRLNNQLWTLDWALRCTRAFDRTVILSSPRTKQQWIGMPESAYENNHSLWNMKLLRANFNFLMEYEVNMVKNDPLLHLPQEVFMDVSDLNPQCVWDDRDRSIWDQFVIQWIKQTDKISQCVRIHLISSHGLIHPKRTSTRTFGVSPFIFWNALQPAKYLRDEVERFLEKIKKNMEDGQKIIAIHSRAHNSYRKYAAPGIPNKSCKRLAEKTFRHALHHLEKIQECCPLLKKKLRKRLPLYYRSFVPPAFEYENQSSITISDAITKYFDDHLYGICHISKPWLDQELRTINLEFPQNNHIIRVSDGEWKDVDELLDSTYLASSFDLEMFRRKGPSDGGSRSPLVKDGEKRKWHQKLESSLIDLIILSEADIFLGAPSSTFSKTACAWRGHYRMRTSNFCFLLMLESGSDDCRSIDCEQLESENAI